MSLSELNRQSREAQDRQEAADKRASTAFHRRLAAQRFLKHNAPLLPAYIRSGGISGKLMSPGVFEEKARLSRTLAVEIAAKVFKKDVAKVSMEEARHFRTEAAEIVADAWDGNLEIDVSIVAEEIAAAVAGADEVYDAETIKWSQISGLGSASLTAAAAAASLTQVIEIYSFRHGHKLVLTTLTAALVTATREGVETMLNEDATDEDRRSLSQTLMRENAAILRTIYETAAREALSELHDSDEKDKKVWLRRKQPLQTIIGTFRQWSRDVCAVAAATAREAVASSKPNEQSPSGH